MSRLIRRRGILSVLSLAAVVWLAAAPARANLNGAAGVVIDTDGVLRTKFFADQTGQLSKERIAAAKANLNPQVAKANTLRKVSITRLEKALRDRFDNGKQATDEMR